MTDAGGKHNTGLLPTFIFSTAYLEKMILHKRTTPNYKYSYSSLPQGLCSSSFESCDRGGRSNSDRLDHRTLTSYCIAPVGGLTVSPSAAIT